MDYRRRNSHHHTFHLHDPESQVWAVDAEDGAGRRYAVLAAGMVHTDGFRSSQSSWHIHDAEHARQLVAAAQQVLAHLAEVEDRSAA